MNAVNRDFIGLCPENKLLLRHRYVATEQFKVSCDKLPGALMILVFDPAVCLSSPGSTST